MKALTAFNWKNSGVNGRRATGRIAAFAALNWKIAALAALNRINCGVKWQITGKTAALTAFFYRYKGTQCV